MKKFNKHKNDDFFTIIDENESAVSSITAPHTLTPQEVLGTAESRKVIVNSHKALDSLKKRMTDAVDSAKEQTNILNNVKTNSADIKPEKEAEIPKEIPDNSPREKSLLDKCMPFLIEDDGTEASPNSEPLYKLQSVAEILKSDSEKVLERLSEKYDISFEDLSLNKTAGFTPANIEEKPDDAEIKTEKEEIKEEPEPEPYISAFEDRIVISDIDKPSGTAEKTENKIDDTDSTVTFTPVTDSGAKTKINISTHTRLLDLTGELADLPDSKSEQFSDEVKLEENEFEEFEPDEELTDEKDAGRLLRKFSLKKRKFFISTAVSALITLILCLSWIPAVSRIILSYTAEAMIVCSALTLMTVIFNIDCFKGVTKIFSRDSSPDISAALSTVFTAVYAIFGIIANEAVTEMLIFLNIVLFFRSLGGFMKSSYMVTNLKIVSSPSPKNTLKLINDSAITYTMAENLVDGDALVADTQPANNLSDFMKYSTHGSFLDGKLPFISAASLILSVITGIVCAFYFDGMVYGFYAAAVMQCLTALPSAFLIDNLPLYKAAERLGSSGAAVLGKTGAMQAEMANAAVINADKLFPPGSVTLHQMQALSANNLEDTIVRAASLTECLGSTLAPIFKTIAGTGNITALPDSDTVKYEDRMGISGWVDNRLLFIGNRTLLETHGIPAPSLEVDRKILRQGYFPVYVATQNRACALIIIQYNVNDEVAAELRRLTDSGVDLLVSSCDPNLTEEMICDYFGLYEDSVKVLSAAGRHTHRNVTAAAKTVSAPAIAGRSSVGIAKVLNVAARIKHSNLLLTVSYILSVILGTLIFAYSSLGGSGNLLSSATVLLYLLITTVISYLLYLIKRP